MKAYPCNRDVSVSKSDSEGGAIVERKLFAFSLSSFVCKPSETNITMSKWTVIIILQFKLEVGHA